MYDLRHHQQKLHALAAEMSAAGAHPDTHRNNYADESPMPALDIPPPQLPPQLFSLAPPPAPFSHVSNSISSSQNNSGGSGASTHIITPLHILAQSAAIISKSEQQHAAPSCT